MKKISLIIALAVAFANLPSVTAHASASSNGCEHSHDQANGCTDSYDPSNVPEPAGLGLLAVGLLVVGGAAYVLRRKRLNQN